MYLKALEIQGFKSFPDRTRISFTEGITAVVGPNGSGKSNISDAIRWVMGETSTKQLRGGGKMENVIFSGTETRNPMGYSSVQLVLDNSDRRIDVDADEVSIGRRYYRSGESEYSINGQNVRLRDVYEMLLDTGLGRDGYSIIGQGRIAEIVGAKSAERREIFEEASGIARFRYRKNEAERDLAAAEDKLERARDILEPMQERLAPLEREAKRAERYLALRDEHRQLEITLWVDTIRSTREELRGQQRKIETARADYEAQCRRMEELDEQAEGDRRAMEAFDIEIERKNADIAAARAAISASDARIAVLENDIQHCREGIEDTEAELARSGEAAGGIATEIARHEEEIERAGERLEETETQIAALEGELADIQRKSLSTGERRGEVEARIADLTAEATELTVREATAATEAETARGRQGEVEGSLQRAAEEAERLVAERADTDTLLQKLEGDLGRLGNIGAGLAMKLEARQKAHAAAEEAERAAGREVDAARQRLSMLRDLERSLDGFQQSTKSVVKAGREGKLRGILGPVSTLLAVEPGYEVAIETALGYALQNIVVEDEASAKAAMSYLKQNKAGRCTFLPLDTVQPRHLDVSRLPEGAQSAKSLVRYDARYENIVSSLLENILVVEGLNDISRVAKAMRYRNRVVSLDGQVANPGGSFTGGSASRTTGLFSRQQEIARLAGGLAAMEQKQAAAAEAAAKAKAEVDALAAEQRATESEAITLRSDKALAEAEARRLDTAISAAEERRARRAAELDELAAALAEAEATRSGAVTRKTALDEELAALRGELSGIAGEDDGFLARQGALGEELGRLRMAAADHRHDAELHRQNIETLRSQSGESAARRATLEANIQRMKAEITTAEGQIATVRRETEESRSRIGELENEVTALRAQRMEKEKAAGDYRRTEREVSSQREVLAGEVARLEEQKNTLESRYDGTIAQLWEEYQLGPVEAEAVCVPFESLPALRSRVNELRSKMRGMGEVHVGAIEEFKELTEQVGDMLAKVRDVEESKRKLEEMIAQLCAEMTRIFASSFDEINRHFGRIFTELFGGGRGRLSLSEPDNILDSGIEIEAAPPGKDIKYLGALSGGEQALVAICIYFAILAVNPAPFCVLDEIEAALDDVNVVRFAQYLRRITARTQFVVITHRRGTMEEADVLYGVTMQEDGVSKMLRLDVSEVDALVVS